MRGNPQPSAYVLSLMGQMPLANPAGRVTKGEAITVSPRGRSGELLKGNADEEE